LRASEVLRTDRCYRAIIERALSGAAVRCAFITGDGSVVELV